MSAPSTDPEGTTPVDRRWFEEALRSQGFVVEPPDEDVETEPGADLEPERCHAGNERVRTLDRACGAVERGEDAVTRELRDMASVARDDAGHERFVRVDDARPLGVANCCGPLG